MAWQKFENTNHRFENRISISSNNAFGFPTRFYNDNKLELFKYVVIFYNSEENAIGFQFNNNEEEKHKFSLVRSKEQYGVSVTATSFFKSYNLDAKQYKGKYTPETVRIDSIGELFVIHLNKVADPQENTLTTSQNQVA